MAESKGRFAKKIAAAAGSLAGLALVPAAAEAAVVHVSGSPVSLSMSAGNGVDATWDVDGINGDDFRLFRRNYGNTSNSGSIQFASQTVGSGYMNGRGLIGPTFYTDNVQALPAGYAVGPTLATYVWGQGAYKSRNAMYYSSYSYYTSAGFAIGYDFNYGFATGDNYMGFRFLSGGNMHYGWANINFDLQSATVSITEWAYESAPDTYINVGAVPEPATSTLFLLGLGAAGLMSWRNRRKKAKAAE